MDDRFDLVEETPLVGRARATRWRHRANGLDVILSERPGCEVASVQIWYRVGSAHEDPTQTGLAHFFEHMMFRGTKTHGVGEYDRILEELGCHGGTNAFTWKDFTAYVQEVPASAVPRVLEMEADRMADLRLDEPNVREEAGVVLDEKRRSLADVDSVRFDVFFEKAFAGQPGHWPVLGSLEHIEAYSPESCEAFYRRWYSPDNACVVVCGDVDPVSLLSEVDRAFGALERGTPVPRVERHLRPGRHVIEQAVHLRRLEINFALDVAGEDTLDWELICRMLAAPETGVFERELVTPGLVLQPSWWIGEAVAGDHVLHLSLALMPEVSPEDVETRVRRLLAQADTWLDETALNVARTESDSDMASGCEGLDDRASALGERWIYNGDLSEFDRRTTRLAEVTPGGLVDKLQALSRSEGCVLIAGPA